MKLATWNVNSLRVRLEQVLDWLKHEKIDILCLQETKLQDQNFPLSVFEEAGYSCVFSGEPSYNGVCILSRLETVGALTSVVKGNPHLNQPDQPKRIITGICNGTYIICAYFPNGQSIESDKYEYKLQWIDSLLSYLASLKPSPIILAGDYNIAPEDIDVYDPKKWVGHVLVSQPERDRFEALKRLGLIDTFRHLNQLQKEFTWWDYRHERFKKNAGLRIDHIMVSGELSNQIKSCFIEKSKRAHSKPSDHAPLVIEM